MKEAELEWENKWGNTRSVKRGFPNAVSSSTMNVWFISCRPRNSKSERVTRRDTKISLLLDDHFKHSPYSREFCKQWNNLEMKGCSRPHPLLIQSLPPKYYAEYSQLLQGLSRVKQLEELPILPIPLTKTWQVDQVSARIGLDRIGVQWFWRDSRDYRHGGLEGRLPRDVKPRDWADFGQFVSQGADQNESLV